MSCPASSLPATVLQLQGLRLSQALDSPSTFQRQLVERPRGSPVGVLGGNTQSPPATWAERLLPSTAASAARTCFWSFMWRSLISCHVICSLFSEALYDFVRFIPREPALFDVLKSRFCLFVDVPVLHSQHYLLWLLLSCPA